ncbi:MAG TPA: UDP-N-acetylmuramoyl-tripeptide--D-alanyl-D-alanine ligase [Thermoanaerobaculia bacterium]|nr:UDP-N-acetylmuramoyl-tripeptide--D-alanyl-D-alanine ligase [Thermoanaerobaculia bacterium]
MRVRTIRDLLQVLSDAEFRGTFAHQRRVVRGFSTDSRTVGKGNAFVALSGENFDGHKFVGTAAEKGSSVAIVSRAWASSNPSADFKIPLVVVDDPLVAYGRIASSHRQSFDIPVLAVAGSNGKTTTKEMIADVLLQKYRVVMTEGNLNNLIGTPATLLRITAEHEVAVIEIGTNAPGEIARLAEIVRPTHGIITNIGREHLELLKNLEGVAREEGALFDYLHGSGGTALINMDDSRLAPWAKETPLRMTYGTRGRPDVKGKITANRFALIEMWFTDRRREGGRAHQVSLQTPGIHSGVNALAAVTAGLALKVSVPNIRKALAAFKPREYHSGYARLAPMRASNGALILNDTYNANPDSVRVGIQALIATKPDRRGRRIVVLGDMRELGASSAHEHEEVGRSLLASKKIDATFFVGSEMRRAHDVIAKSASRIETFFFEDKVALADLLKQMLRSQDIVLVKGSRGMQMEDVVKSLAASAG